MLKKIIAWFFLVIPAGAIPASASWIMKLHNFEAAFFGLSFGIVYGFVYSMIFHRYLWNES